MKRFANVDGRNGVGPSYVSPSTGGIILGGCLTLIGVMVGVISILIGQIGDRGPEFVRTEIWLLRGSLVYVFIIAIAAVASARCVQGQSVPAAVIVWPFYIGVVGAFGGLLILSWEYIWR